MRRKSAFLRKITYFVVEKSRLGTEFFDNEIDSKLINIRIEIFLFVFINDFRKISRIRIQFLRHRLQRETFFCKIGSSLKGDELFEDNLLRFFRDEL